jgi:DNA-binding PadR family transcriptional regulator
MLNTRVYQWLNASNEVKKVLLAFNQPLISRQISKKTAIPAHTCSYVITKLENSGVLICLNSGARSSRLYWLTENGHHYLQTLYTRQNRTYNKPILPAMDWSVYGWACFSHRSAIIKALTHPMQPSEIKRFFRLQGTHIRISSNNIRDIIKLFLSKGIVCPLKVRKRVHPRYELTDIGIKIRDLLIRAEVGPLAIQWKSL